MKQFNTFSTCGGNIKNEWDSEEINNIIRNNDRLIITADYAGCGKSTCFTNCFKDEKESVLFVCPSNRLCMDYITKGFLSHTGHRTLQLGIEGNIMKDMAIVDLSKIKYIVWDEVYCYNLKVRTHIEYFMRKHKDIKFYGTGDTFQLQSPNCDEKEFKYISDKMVNTFPNNIHLKEIKRCKDKADIELIHKLKEQIFDETYAWNEARIREILKVFPSIDIKDITCLNTICYLRETEAIVNAKINQIRGGMKEGDIISVRNKLHKKKEPPRGGIICHTNCEYRIVKRNTDGLVIRDITGASDEFTISRTEFGNHFGLNYAYTNHTLQGISMEGDGVICDVLFWGASRNWLYTALTRFRDMKKIKICYNKNADKLYVKNFSKKVEGHIKADREAGRAYDLKDYVNFDWFLGQLKKQMFRCYNDNCGINLELNYEDGSQQQYSIDRKDSKKCHSRDNSRIMCLNCNVSLKTNSEKI